MKYKYDIQYIQSCIAKTGLQVSQALSRPFHSQDALDFCILFPSLPSAVNSHTKENFSFMTVPQICQRNYPQIFTPDVLLMFIYGGYISHGSHCGYCRHSGQGGHGDNEVSEAP